MRNRHPAQKMSLSGFLGSLRSLNKPSAHQAQLAVMVIVFAVAGIIMFTAIKAATFVVTSEAENGQTTTAYTMSEPGASNGQAVQFGSKAGDCNNFCSNPVNPIFKTSPVAINTKVNIAWCGPTWDAPQAEFDLVRQKMGANAIVTPPCKKGGGYYDQTPEQFKIELDKAQQSGVKVIVFGGYTCADAFNHYCYKGFTNPDSMIDKFAYHPALAGYFIHDEPNAQEFPDTAKAVDRIHLRRPGLLAYTNLLGGFGSTGPGSIYGQDANGNDLTYAQYVTTFINTVKVNVLSVDDYSSAANLESTLKTIDTAAKKAQTTTRPDLASGYQLWSAISTVGLNATLTQDYFKQNNPDYLAANAKYNATTLYFTWRSPPGGGDGFSQPSAGPALCGLVNNSNPGTMCGN